MTDQEKYVIIKKFIDQMDYYNLLSGGAPSDEFDTESREIAARVRRGQSSEEIAKIIASVFNHYFSEHDEPLVFWPVAEQIRKELSN